MKFIKYFLTAIIFTISFSTIALTVYAQSKTPTSLNFIPEVSIPGSSFNADKSISVGQYIATSGKMSSDLLSKYIQALYNYGLAIVSILAAIVLMGGGLLWLTSGGDSSKITKAKEMIFGSLTGMVILFCAWIILNTVNPDLLKLKPIETIVIAKVNIGCCEDTGKAEMTTEADCKKKQGASFKIAAYATNGLTCVAAGCCITELNSSNNSFSCVNTIKDYCKGDSTFVDGSCSSIKNQYNCIAGDACETTENGDPCYYGISDSYCYNKLCWVGPGSYNEPCGNDPLATCSSHWKSVPSFDPITCTTPGYKHDAISFTGHGRDCKHDYACCYPAK